MKKRKNPTITLEVSFKDIKDYWGRPSKAQIRERIAEIKDTFPFLKMVEKK